MDQTRITSSVGKKTSPMRVGEKMIILVDRIRKQMIQRNSTSPARYDISDAAITDYIAKLFVSKGLA